MGTITRVGTNYKTPEQVAESLLALGFKLLASSRGVNHPLFKPLIESVKYWQKVAATELRLEQYDRIADNILLNAAETETLPVPKCLKGY